MLLVRLGPQRARSRSKAHAVPGVAADSAPSRSSKVALKHDVNESGSSHGTKPFVCACVGVCQRQWRRSFGGDALLPRSSFVVRRRRTWRRHRKENFFWRVFDFYLFRAKNFCAPKFEIWATWLILI